MKKMVTTFFVGCLFAVFFAMTAMAAETATMYTWYQDEAGYWCLHNNQTDAKVTNSAIVVETVGTTAGPGVKEKKYYLLDDDGRLVSKNGTYWGTQVTFNQEHDGFYGCILTGAEELVASNPDKVIDMSTTYDDGATVGVAPGETTSESDEVTYEWIQSVEPSYIRPSAYNHHYSNGDWVYLATGTYNVDFISVSQEDGKIWLFSHVATRPWIKDHNTYGPTQQEVIEVFNELY